MTRKTICITDEIYEYLIASSLREPELLRKLREETATYAYREMQISPEQGQFMGLLVLLMGAVSALEIGVFTGYSSLCVASALPPEGRMVACDINEQYTSVAARYWKEAGVAHKIDLRLKPASVTLDQLISDGEEGAFDFAFIDADKENEYEYYERCLTLVRPGGVILIDNVLWSGRVADPAVNDPTTKSIREFNERVRDDERVDMVLVPIADGLTVAMKRI